MLPSSNFPFRRGCCANGSGNGGMRALTDDLIDRTPPSNLEIEKELLSALFMDERCEYAFEHLEKLDFHDPFHGWLFIELNVAWQKNTPFQSSGELIALSKNRNWQDQLAKNTSSDSVLNDVMLLIRDATCSRWVPNGSAANIPYYCEVLRGLRRRRASVRLSIDLLVKAHDATMDSESWTEYVTAQVSRIGLIHSLVRANT